MRIAVIFLCLVIASAVAMQSMSIKRTKPGVSTNDLRNFLRLDHPGKNIPVGGNIVPLGIFYIEVTIGSPPVIFNVAFDTGSGDLIVPGEGCVGCHLEKEGIYVPENSTSSKKVDCEFFTCPKCVNQQCAFKNTYETCNITDPNQPCTVSGPVYEDVTALAGLSTPVRFGTITFQTANFEQFYVIDGVIGFADSSGFGATTPFASLAKAGKVDNVFSWCFNAGKFPHSGVLTIGGADPKYYTGEISYTPLTSGYFNGYTIETTGLSLGQDSIRSSSAEYIIDSGTNTLLLSQDDYQLIKKQFIGNCNGVRLPGICNSGKTFFDGVCFEVSADEMKDFPTVSMKFSGDVTMTMSAEEYLLPDIKKGGDYKCFGILPSSIPIIGDVLMKPYYTVIDNAQQRFGFAPVDRTACLKGV